MKKISLSVVLMLVLKMGIAAPLTESVQAENALSMFNRVREVMTGSPLYAALVMLNEQLPSFAHAAEYVTFLSLLSENNQKLDALLAEIKTGNERLAAIHEALTKTS
ncbi:Uncharacterised protein [Legionella donaldsonii]|uniref:Chemiosmotic efflux system C protein A n=1 Tax=Legionella donaldsonii TaxID=45060 RepID=A0A378KSV2_9GAMM|nr:hypothetical protein [Legionella donaldsonii]STX84884.1 Uncharacterised protein [Legionella donaldsonii]